MSLRTYTGPAPAIRVAPSGVAFGWFMALAAIALQICYPLVDKPDRATLSLYAVLVFFAAVVVHATTYHRLRGFLMVGLVVPAIGWLAERIGSTTGYPFGDYSYTDQLAPFVLGVPLAVPLAWSMMGYPAYVAASTIVARRRWLVPLVAGWALMAWDLFLDPMMTDLNAWNWNRVTPDLLGVTGIPLTNYAGWLAVGVLVGAVLLVLPARRASPAQPAALFLWVYASSVLAAATFFDRPEVALVGGIAMGLVAFPLTWFLWVDRQ